MIKSCQFLGTRADILPRQYVEVLSQLHDRVPARSAAAIIGALETELGRPCSEVFADFDERPIASASLAQQAYTQANAGAAPEGGAGAGAGAGPAGGGKQDDVLDAEFEEVKDKKTGN